MDALACAWESSKAPGSVQVETWPPCSCEAVSTSRACAWQRRMKETKKGRKNSTRCKLTMRIVARHGCTGRRGMAWCMLGLDCRGGRVRLPRWKGLRLDWCCCSSWTCMSGSLAFPRTLGCAQGGHGWPEASHELPVIHAVGYGGLPQYMMREQELTGPSPKIGRPLHRFLAPGSMCGTGFWLLATPRNGCVSCVGNVNLIQDLEGLLDALCTGRHTSFGQQVATCKTPSHDLPLQALRCAYCSVQVAGPEPLVSEAACACTKRLCAGRTCTPHS
jgi:hypothetical protein